METAIGIKMLNPLVAVIGSFERERVVQPKPKVKPKPAPPPPKKGSDSPKDTQVEDIDLNEDPLAIIPHKNVGAENLAKEMNKILKNIYRDKPEAINIFEFTLDRTSFPKTVENIFYMSFLVKDGFVSLSKEDPPRFRELSLNVKPEKYRQIQEAAGLDEEETSRNKTHRQKYIFSFSPRMWKQMCAMGKGEDLIAGFDRGTAPPLPVMRPFEPLGRGQGIDPNGPLAKLLALGAANRKNAGISALKFDKGKGEAT